MPNYRRLYVPGGTVALTTTLQDRSSALLTDRIEDLRRAYATVAKQRPFETVAICILPDHVHMLWVLPEHDSDYATRLRLIKGAFTKSLPDNLKSTGRKGERGIWQQRYYEHHIRDDTDHTNHVNYIHANPVKHGLAHGMDDWPYSTWHKFKEEYGRAWTPPPIDMRM